MKRLALILCTFAAPVFADGFINGVPVDCYCTDSKGQRIEVGETICLQVDGRMFMAQCQMSLNVPMWREVSPGCLSSGLIGGQSRNPLIHTYSIDAEILATKS
ncbi:hypothetical protein shim_06870 [Shimia sp. SK013]|uniref:hypothetical protein n=1 Tax=Shimia sp. SK013 TaxID=1389006 RepID=UPI0006CD7157|nr:hypothetical protein [Shimia sp. SK013]KPA22407.1 hypothetical protein shim_06870 [Shimia sp. SK013]